MKRDRIEGERDKVVEGGGWGKLEGGRGRRKKRRQKGEEGRRVRKR